MGDLRPPVEWVCAGSPLVGETVSGDLAFVDCVGSAYLLACIDGLGHGAAAGAAAALAAETLAENLAEPLEGLLLLCHQALARSRGAAITLARIDVDQEVLTWVGVGNVAAVLLRTGPAGSSIVAEPVLSGGIVGFDLPRVTVRRVELQRSDVVVMATDGIDRRFADELGPSREIRTVADGVLRDGAKGTDDALVLVGWFRGSLDD